MNPFRDFALWSGQLAPSQDLEVIYQLSGFALSFFLLGALAMLAGALIERLIK
ncbi:hypothetical protein HVE01_30880 [Vreelandella venusta]|nr:hypothetical protein HVE01_30880 [Halomonas venusta]